MVEEANSAPNAAPGSPERFLAAIVDSSDDAIVGKLIDGTITSWNAGAERMYGYTADEVVGEHISLIVPSDLREELEEILARIARGERVVHYDTRRVNKEGTEIAVSVTISPIRDSSGAVIGASAIGRDISDREAIEQSRRVLESRLRQSERLESLGQMAGGIAHDFNNLLAVILNYTDFVDDELPVDSRAAADLEQIRAAARRAADLTRQLLVFARREVLQPVIVDLNTVVSGLSELLSRTLGEHIDYVTTLDPELAPVQFDPTQLEQVIVNLALNARDAMRNGGRLVVDTANVVIDESYAGSHPGLRPGSYVRMRVSDTGTGMSRSVLEHAFEPFYTTKPSGEGTGLGLATVYGIVTQARGYVQLYSEPGFGTTCQVLIPSSAQAATDVHVSSAEETRRGSETILLVEDGSELREAVRRMLTANGYEVVACANGREALAAAEDLDGVDLLLTDVVMPEMVGTDLAALLQARVPGLAVLFMSGFAQPVLGSEIGDEAILLAKPFSRQSLLERVREALERRPER